MTLDKGSLVLAKYVEDIRTENGLPQSLFDQIESVIRDYCFYASIRHGEEVTIAKGAEPISWHFNNDYLTPNERVTICFKRGREWVDDCYLDELPVELLLHLLKMINNRRPLWDPRPITVEATTTAYIEAREAEKAKRDLEKQLHFNVKGRAYD
jgi:hypothetical protein